MGIQIKQFVALAGAVAYSVVGAQADFTLIDGTAKIVVDPSSQAGMKEWSIFGQNQAFQQWFWYRPGGTTGQQSIDVGGTLTATTSGTDQLNLKYNYGTFTIDIFYNLNGSGGNSASLIQNVGITNLTGQTITLDFFQYNNFDLGNDAGSDYVQVFQNYAYQEDGGLFISEGDIQPPATFFEAGLANVPGATLQKLNNPASLDLNLSSGVDEILSGDVTWAFQWHIELLAGEGTDIIKNQNLAITLIPEPTTLSIGVTSLALLGLMRRRKN